MIKMIGMNSVHVIAVVLIIAALLGALIALRKPHSIDITGLTYEELCIKNGDQWMEMEPTIKGKKLSTEMCRGCMIADNHFCTADEYIGYVKNLPFR